VSMRDRYHQLEGKDKVGSGKRIHEGVTGTIGHGYAGQHRFAAFSTVADWTWDRELFLFPPLF
jgi:hypothetical protein